MNQVKKSSACEVRLRQKAVSNSLPNPIIRPQPLSLHPIDCLQYQHPQREHRMMQQQRHIKDYPARHLQSQHPSVLFVIMCLEEDNGTVYDFKQCICIEHKIEEFSGNPDVFSFLLCLYMVCRSILRNKSYAVCRAQVRTKSLLLTDVSSSQKCHSCLPWAVQAFRTGSNYSDLVSW